MLTKRHKALARVSLKRLTVSTLAEVRLCSRQDIGRDFSGQLTEEKV